ncbi:hypothetical protein JCM6882_002627 [Rhodosporidiobolus microsporus]
MSGRRLYVGRVPQHATNRDFQDHFGAIGKLVETRIMAGFAFVEYDQLRDAEQAVQELNNKDFLNERILVEFAKPPRAMMDDRYGPRGGFGGPPRGYGGYGGGGYDNYGPPRNPLARPGNGYRLTISGLGQGTSWQDLKDFGRQVGSVSFADVDRNDPTIGFIEFGSRRDADDAIDRLNNKDLHGSVVTVTEERGSSRRDDDRRGDDGYRSRGGDDGYRSSSTRDRYDDRDRRDERSSRRRSPTPERRRSRSPDRRRSRSPVEKRDDRERSPARERSRSPIREDY